MRANVYFCGAGGSSHGLHLAGFDVIGYDNWQPAVDTHNANGMLAHLHDLSDASLDHLLDPCDLAMFTAPCQPFSAAGDGEGEFDGRDGFPWALRILALTLPPVAIFENVKGLTFRKHRRYLSGILESIRGLGYHLEHKVLNCADYGVPQTRKRFIMVARRDGGRITWPTVTHTETAGMFTAGWVSMASALGWGMIGRPAYCITAGSVGSAESIGSSWVRDRLKSERDDGERWMLDRRTNSTYGNGEVGPTATVSIDRPAPAVVTSNGQWLWVTAGDAKNATRRSTTEPAPTITTGAGGKNAWTRPATTITGDNRVFQPGGHHQPGEQSQNAIRVTINELATLQGFPPGWVWCGNKTEQARQIGNAVPPRLAEVVSAANWACGVCGGISTPKRDGDDAMSVQCCRRVSDGSGWHSYQCSKPAKVQRGDDWYCTIHDPERIKAKRDAVNAAQDAAREASQQNMAGAASLLDRVKELTGVWPVGRPEMDRHTGRYTGDVVLTAAALTALLNAANSGAGVSGTPPQPADGAQ